MKKQMKSFLSHEAHWMALISVCTTAFTGNHLHFCGGMARLSWPDSNQTWTKTLLYHVVQCKIWLICYLESQEFIQRCLCSSGQWLREKLLEFIYIDCAEKQKQQFQLLFDRPTYLVLTWVRTEDGLWMCVHIIWV